MQAATLLDETLDGKAASESRAGPLRARLLCARADVAVAAGASGLALDLASVCVCASERQS